MNLMLVAVTVVSFLIGEVSTGVIVALLIVLNVVLGSTQELKARASVDALSQPAGARWPRSSGRRSWSWSRPSTSSPVTSSSSRPATSCRPTDGSSGRPRSRPRKPRSPGRAHRWPRATATLASTTSPSGDRTNMLFQNTSVTRGTAIDRRDRDRDGDPDGPDRDDAHVGHAEPFAAAAGAGLPDEGHRAIAWTAVAFIVVVGLIRGMPLDEVLLVGTAMAISAIPTGTPRLRLGAAVHGRQAARGGEGRREEPHRRRDPRRDECDQHRQDRHADDEPDDGLDALRQRVLVQRRRRGLRQDRRRSRPSPGRRCRTSPGWRSVSSSTATRPCPTTAPSSATRPRPPSSSSPRSSARTPRRPGAPTRGSPRCPFDSDYKFMATFHRVTIDGVERVVQLVKGGPDVVLARCSQSGGPLSDAPVPMEQARSGIDAANDRMGEKGLRVLAFAARFVGDDELPAMTRRPDVAGARPGVRRDGRDHRPAACVVEGRGADSAEGRHRRPDDHRRPRGDRPGDRRDARPGRGRDQRARAAGAHRRRAQGATALACTSSDG